MNPHKNFNYEKSAKELKKLLYQIADIKIKKVEKIRYEGEEIKSSYILACSDNILDSFSLESIEYNKDRDRDLIDIFINKVFQLGYSVGTEKIIEQNEPIIKIFEKVYEKEK